MRLNKVRQYWVSLLITIVLLFVCLELYARYQLSHEPDGNEVNILYEEKFPAINQLLANRRVVGDAGLSYYDYSLFAKAPIKTELMTFTQYFSARSVPDSIPLGTNSPIVWLFGGSTMQNMETTDELSIANQVAVNLRKAGYPVTVVNFGVGGFQSSLESIKFQELLRQVPPNERPSVVVFYDGFNDAGLASIFKAGSYQNDLVKKIEALVVGHHKKMFFYSLGNLIGEVSTYWKNKLAFKYSRAIFGEDFVKYDQGNLLKAVNIYEINTRMIRGICKEFGIETVFLLQPMIYTKKNLTDFENKIFYRPGNQEKIKFMNDFYKLARLSMEKYDDFSDLSGILDDSKKTDFYDLGHTGPFTGIIIGKHIEQIVEPYLLNNN